MMHDTMTAPHGNPGVYGQPRVTARAHRGPRGRRGRVGTICAVSVALTACGASNAGAPAATHRATAAATATPRATAGPTATAAAGRSPAVTAAAADPLTTCPAGQAEGALPVLVRTGGTPDDLVAAGGGLWVSDETRGTITNYSTTGAVQSSLGDPRGPEGIIALGDGSLVVAEQLADRVVVLQPPNATPRVLLTLEPLAGHDGIDGIGVDSGGGRYLIPDSARGTLLGLPFSGGPATTLASGLGRPVAATIGPDGAIYVATEERPGLWRVPSAGGTPVPFGNQNDLDEVVTVGRLLYVASLADGSVRVIDPATGTARILVTGGNMPQGLNTLPDGRLAVSDSGRGLIFAVAACG